MRLDVVEPCRVPDSRTEEYHALRVRLRAALSRLSRRWAKFSIQCFRAWVADVRLLLLPEFTQALFPGIVRVSLGIGNDESDVEHLLETLRSIHEATRTRVERIMAAAHNANPFTSGACKVDSMTSVSEDLMADVYLADDELRRVDRPAALSVVGA